MVDAVKSRHAERTQEKDTFLLRGLGFFCTFEAEEAINLARGLSAARQISSQLL